MVVPTPKPNNSIHFFPLPPQSKKKKYVIGVCAMDAKARSAPMRNILNRIITDDTFETIIFGDKVILDENIENWPTCDFLLSFFSTGFPLDKAIEYVKLRKPYCINDLELQKIIWDRRLVLNLLETIGVPTPRRLVVSRDGGPVITPAIRERLAPPVRVKFQKINTQVEPFKVIDQDTIMVGDQTLSKPFVEKPVDGENHNINIYYPSSDGGGTRRLFRKIANKSSEFDSENHQVRTDVSYIYEDFIDVDNSEDIKVYTVGPNYAHAETRKSPVVDGIVRRNVSGKEMRFVCKLSIEEREMARRICMTFGQTVCGFDLLRMGGKSYVIDVNGWSFVKGNDQYYDDCAQILRTLFTNAAQRRWLSYLMYKEPTYENAWTLKGFISVFRHADRTPKQKAKFKLFCYEFSQFLNMQSKDEAILRKSSELNAFTNAIQTALNNPDNGNHDKLKQMEMIMGKKGDLPGTKVQIKPTFSKSNKNPQSMQVIIKWGGEFTHAAYHHSRELGENMRKDLTIINKSIFDDIKVYSSSERRVLGTAETFTEAFLDINKVPPGFISIKKELLDDSNDAKEQTDLVKLELRDILQNDGATTIKPCYDAKLIEKEDLRPKELATDIKKELLRVQTIMHQNIDKMAAQEPTEWCCSETPYLFFERWEKLIKEFCDVTEDKFDPGKVCEIYDSLKYDALHNRDFLENVFTIENDPSSVENLKQLYKNAKIFFDFVAPREYGISDEEKLNIGMLTSRHLLFSIVNDLNSIRDSPNPSTRLYFTKESHIHTLLNIVLLSGLPIRIPNHEFGELDYLTQITFELYECQRDNGEQKEWSLRLGFSPGAHHSFIMDLQMDDRHALSVASRRDLTDHVELSKALNSFQTLLNKDWKPLSPTSTRSESPSVISPIISPTKNINTLPK